MKLLAIEAAFESCSVGLWLDGTYCERFAPGPRGHAENLLPFVQSLMEESGSALSALDGIAFSRGPGSFTSLRIGIGVVQGLAWGADLPVIPVSSLRCVAQEVVSEGVDRAWVAVDARMDEVFSACFVANKGLMELDGEERVCAPESAIPGDPGTWSAVGNGFERYSGLAGTPVQNRWPAAIARAHAVAVLGATDFARGLALPAEQAQPVYLRNQVADKPGNT